MNFCSHVKSTTYWSVNFKLFIGYIYVLFFCQKYAVCLIRLFCKQSKINIGSRKGLASIWLQAISWSITSFKMFPRHINTNLFSPQYEYKWVSSDIFCLSTKHRYINYYVKLQNYPFKNNILNYIEHTIKIPDNQYEYD